VGEKPAGSDASLDVQLNAPLVITSTKKNVLPLTPTLPTPALPLPLSPPEITSSPSKKLEEDATG
jgi:hypothetical protein